MADILGLDPRTIDESTAMDGIEAWDSFNHLQLCLALEQEFGMTLSVDEMEAMVSYLDIVDTVQSKVSH